MSRRQSQALRPQIDPTLAQWVEATIQSALEHQAAAGAAGAGAYAPSPAERSDQRAELAAVRLTLSTLARQVADIAAELASHVERDRSASALTLTRARLLRALHDLEQKDAPL